MTPLALLFILAFLVSVDVRILSPVLPSIAASLGATAGSAGLAMTSYALAYGLVDAGRDNLMLAIAGVGLALVGALTAGVRFGRTL
jgi:MFS family permease